MYEISEELLQATVNYLATRPIQEVDNLYHLLRSLKKSEKSEKSEKKVEEKK